MTNRRYPTTGRKKFLKVLDSQDYVEVEDFDGPNIGYFCSTCTHFISEGVTSGVCGLLDNAPVQTFGCCNAWSMVENDGEPLLRADGEEE